MVRSVSWGCCSAAFSAQLRHGRRLGARHSSVGAVNLRSQSAERAMGHGERQSSISTVHGKSLKTLVTYRMPVWVTVASRCEKCYRVISTVSKIQTRIKNLMMFSFLSILLYISQPKRLLMSLPPKQNSVTLSHQSHPLVSTRFGTIRVNLEKKILNDGVIQRILTILFLQVLDVP